MRRIFLAAAALPLVCPVSAVAQSLPCAEFNKNVQTLDGKWEKASDASGMGLSMGFLLGYFVAKRGEHLEEFQEKEFSIYLRDVMNRCTSNPTKHVMMVAMEAEVPAPSGQKKNKAEIDLIDLKLDIGKMSGKEVVVHGTISVLGDLAMLGDGGFDTTPVPVDIGKLSRADRKKILESCNMQCGVTITGKIGPFMMQKGIIARSIELD
jgi:hypothetical protein